MGWITGHVNAMLACIFKEGMGIVEVMSINNEELIISICLPFGMFVKFLDPLDADLTIYSTFFQVSKASIQCMY